MLDDIKQELLKNPQSIVSLLEQFEFQNITYGKKEIRCGIDDTHNASSIRIKLYNNDKLFVKDYGRNLNYDLITYIIKVRHVSFYDVASAIKNELGIQDFYSFSGKKKVFGGFYDKIKNRSSYFDVAVYNENILEEYADVYNSRFAKDNINFQAQSQFKLRYDTISQRIIIPIYDAYGSLIGVKGRANWDTSKEEAKYLYLVPCLMSQTLYGYAQNYEFLTNNDILVFESEKAVMQCYSYGIRNCVSIGSNSLSLQQCRLLLELNPQRIVFMLDEGLDRSIIESNIQLLHSFCKMTDTTLWYWDCSIDKTIPQKASPSDLGRTKLLEILKTQIKEENI